MVDSRFCVEVISQTPNPQQTMYAAMHQDYAEVFVAHDRNEWPSEERCGPIIVNNLLKGGRGHYGCYDAKTEVLTGRGWLAWPFVMPHHKLLAVDIESGTCRFEQPSALQRIACHGDRLYGVSSAFLDFRVTLDHRMVVSHRKKTGGFSDWYFSPASDVIGRPVRYLLNSCLEESSRGLPDGMPENIDSLTAFKVAGFFFGDGVRSKNAEPSCVRFRIRRPKKVAYLLSLGLKTFERKGDRFTIEHQSLARWIHANFSGENGKVVPEWILTLPEAETAAFWDGLKNSDGTRITNKSWAYDSCEKEALDLIQAAAHINGFSANMTLNNPNDGIGHNNHEPCWRLTISEHSTRRVETSQGRSPGITETQDTYTGHVYCATVSTGALMVRRNNKAFVSGNCLEHPQIVFNVGWFPHSTMQQIRTHRVGVSFDCQSFRYTGQRILDVVDGKRDVEEVFYLRPLGDYSDRQGKKYEYTTEARQQDLDWCLEASRRYKIRIEQGFAEEHARGLIPFDIRQHWVMSANVRSIMHILDLRWPANAQLEAQKLCDAIFPHFELWVPAIAEWYMKDRAKKSRLSP
jgi:thymidylate synthase (FAD)